MTGEDGIRDKLVTGVQTCALPISGYPLLTHSLLMAQFVLKFVARGFSPVLLFLFASSVVLAAAGLSPATSAAFDRYARLTEQRINAEVARTSDFLWIDTLPESRRTEVLQGLQQSGVIIERLQTRDG